MMPSFKLEDDLIVRAQKKIVITDKFFSDMLAINSFDVRDKNPYKSGNDEMNSYIMHG